MSICFFTRGAVRFCLFPSFFPLSFEIFVSPTLLYWDVSANDRRLLASLQSSDPFQTPSCDSTRRTFRTGDWLRRGSSSGVNGDDGSDERRRDPERKVLDHDEAADLSDFASPGSASSQLHPCEEGFQLDYLSPVPRAKPSLLDFVRQQDIRRGQRKWQHYDPVHRRLTPLDHDLDVGDTGGTYRLDDQERLLEERRTRLPPWVRRPMSMLQLTDRPFCIEVEGGGKLGNKIHDVEISVEQLRVDTRYSIWRSRIQSVEEGSTALNEKLENLEKWVRRDEAMRDIAGDVYEPMMLLTIGAQGSGKSKFSFDLVEYGALPWARINQDTIRNGRRGTKEDCVAKAKYMMKLGYCVVIDRMNYSIDQRDLFVELSRAMRCPIHAVVFRLPFVENVYNVAHRKDHEGNFEGNTILHRQIIYYTRSRILTGGHPKDTDEGFRSVFECRANEDYAFAFRQWMNIGRREQPIDQATVDSWMKTQPPWRPTDAPDLQDIEDIINEEEPWTWTPQLPIVELPKDSEEEIYRQQQTIGYVPSRDGPLSPSDDDR